MKMWNQLILGAAVFVTASAMAFADDSMTANKMMMPLTSQQFVNDAVWGNDKEIAAGRLAEEKSQNEAVKRFGGRMMRDHSRVNDRLVAIANEEGLSCPSTNSVYFGANNERMADTSGSPNLDNPKGLPAAALMKNSWDERTNADIESLHNLSAMSGAEFDQTYANEMVKDHEMAIAEYENAATNLDDARLKQFAGRTLPALRAHYRMAQHLQEKVGGTAATSQ